MIFRPKATQITATVNHDQTVAVHEHRAPTDASVKLLREMEGAAKAQVEKTIRVDDNLITMVVHVFEDHFNDQRVAKAIYDINGKRMTSEARVYARDQNPMALPSELVDAIAKDIALTLVNMKLTELLRERM